MIRKAHSVCESSGKNLCKWLSGCVRQIEIGDGGSPEIKSSWWSWYSEDQKLYIPSPLLRCFMSELLRSPFFLGVTLYRRVIGSRRSWGERTRDIWKVSSHFKHLENWSSGLVTWQPVRGDLTAHPWTSLSRWASQSAVRRRLLSLLLCDCRIHNDRASRSANVHQCACPFYSSRSGFLAKVTLPRSISNSTAKIWLPASSGFSQSPFKVRRFVNATVTQYTSSANGVSLPTD